MKNKKKFFWLLYKKMPFFKILHVNDYMLKYYYIDMSYTKYKNYLDKT